MWYSNDDMMLTRAGEYLLLLLRVTMGWLLLYSGYSKLIDNSWSIATSLSGSHYAQSLYTMLSSQPALDILNTWYPIALIACGIMIFTGLWMKIGAGISILLLILTYIPTLPSPLFSLSHTFIDSHIIYILVILALTTIHAGKLWGLDASIRLNK